MLGRVSDRDELLAGIKAKAVVYGDFVLSSGRRASSYVDLRRVTLDGRLAPLAGRVLLNATADLSYDAVGGLTLGADPLATATSVVSFQHGKPRSAFIVRKEPKGHGTGQWLESPGLTAGAPVVIVEDVVTTGASTLRAIERARQAGLEVLHALGVIDRLEGGREAIEAHAPLVTLFTRRDFLST
jgi:orotate phosphoribosyltransferase